MRRRQVIPGNATAAETLARLNAATAALEQAVREFEPIIEREERRQRQLVSTGGRSGR